VDRESGVAVPANFVVDGWAALKSSGKLRNASLDVEVGVGTDVLTWMEPGQPRRRRPCGCGTPGRPAPRWSANGIASHAKINDSGFVRLDLAVTTGHPLGRVVGASDF